MSKEDNIENKSKEECIPVYDIFYHCLSYHGKTEMYKLLFDENDHKCDEECAIYQRYNNNEYDKDRSNNEKWLMDRIHCYY